MNYRFVIYETEGPIARITLNRRKKLNAFGFAEGIAASLSRTIGYRGPDRRRYLEETT